jgi:hypothetical protein
MDGSEPERREQPAADAGASRHVLDYEFWVDYVDPGVLESKATATGTRVIVEQAIRERFRLAVRRQYGGTMESRIVGLGEGGASGTIALDLGTGVSVHEFVARYRDFDESLSPLTESLRTAVSGALEGLPDSLEVVVRVMMTPAEGYFAIADARRNQGLPCGTIAKVGAVGAVIWLVVGYAILSTCRMSEPSTIWIMLSPVALPVIAVAGLLLAVLVRWLVLRRGGRDAGRASTMAFGIWYVVAFSVLVTGLFWDCL